MSEWQPIKTAPKDGTLCLLYGEWAGEINGSNGTKAIDIGCYFDGRSDYPGGDWWQLLTGDAYACWMKATHWIPLPQPPNPVRKTMKENDNLFAQAEKPTLWSKDGYVWVDDGSGVPWLAEVWFCNEDGRKDYRPLPVVKLLQPSKA